MRDADTCECRPCRSDLCRTDGDERCLREHEAMWLDEAADAAIDRQQEEA